MTSAEGVTSSTRGLPGEEKEPSILLSMDRIQMVEEIGEGTSAKVHLGSLDGQEVAVKRMNDKISAMSNRSKLNLAREVKILQRVNHDHLVKFFGIAESGGVCHIVMEYCSGDTVFDILYDESETFDISWPQKTKICQDVASAMLYLHTFQPQIIHRDLKSLNLLLKQTLESSIDIPFVKVADFGHSRLVPEGGCQMTKGAGTDHWRAPEMFEETAYDEKVDVYSYSMVLYEVLCQQVPFEEVTDKARLCLKVLQGQRPSLEALLPDCPEALSSVMIRCWSPEPSDRPSFGEICDLIPRAGL
jgi:serine/threonine protein kinase